MENQESQKPEPTVEKFLEQVEKKNAENEVSQEKENLEHKRHNDEEFKELSQQEEEKAREAEKFVGS
ncbi:hypothetical protein [Siphonobacter sp.]|uniref:hypothetical protein n=1 Tax=Siphonobacter sp. TaxID=1869184 RepID=UPI003B3B87D5